MPSPLRNARPENIDFIVIRENNEGEYSEIGGRLYQGTDDEMASQTSIFTRKGVDRVMRYAFDLAMKRKDKHVTLATMMPPRRRRAYGARPQAGRKRARRNRGRPSRRLHGS